jgi:hypothetical protein
MNSGYVGLKDNDNTMTFTNIHDLVVFDMI